MIRGGINRIRSRIFGVGGSPIVVTAPPPPQNRVHLDQFSTVYS